VPFVAPLQPFALAYNLGNFLRRLALPRAVKHWSLTTLREKLVKIGAKVVTHARYVIFQMAEVAIPRKLFAAILERIRRLRRPAVGVAPSGRASRPLQAAPVRTSRVDPLRPAGRTRRSPAYRKPLRPAARASPASFHPRRRGKSLKNVGAGRRGAVQ
jgi:hypothetical protein